MASRNNNFAKIFLSFHERTWLADGPHTFTPMLYRRYVDDCFLIFQSKEQVIPFFDFLNSKHPNIQFTHELENNGSLSFLDINITRLAVASLPLCFANLPQQDSLQTLTALSL